MENVCAVHEQWEYWQEHGASVLPILARHRQRYIYPGHRYHYGASVMPMFGHYGQLGTIISFPTGCSVVDDEPISGTHWHHVFANIPISHVLLHKHFL